MELEIIKDIIEIIERKPKEAKDILIQLYKQEQIENELLMSIH